MKRALLLLAISYSGVVLMITYGDRLGHGRLPILMVIGFGSLWSFHALYECARSEEEGNKTKWVASSLLWLFVLGSAGGLAYQIGIRVVALLKD